MIFTPEELQTGRLNAFTQLPQGTRRSGAPFPRNYPEQDFDAICLHRPEMTAPRILSAKRTAKFFSKMSSPYHIWLCGPDATRQKYSKKIAGSYIRDSNAVLTDGYTEAFQRLDLNTCGWALKNDDGGKPIHIVLPDGTSEVRKMQTNRRGRLIQITLAGWSADSSFTTDEDYQFYAHHIALVAVWLRLTNPNGTDFRFDPCQEKGNIGLAHMSDELWMSQDSKRLFDHGAVPSGNSHWDVGPLDFRKLADMAKSLYDLRLSGVGKPQQPEQQVGEATAIGATLQPAAVPEPVPEDRLAAAQSLLGKAQYQITQYRKEQQQ